MIFAPRPTLPRRILSHPALSFLITLIAILAASHTAQAQADATAGKSADLAVFLNASLVNTAYAGTAQPGFSVGLDYTRYLRFLSLAPSIEARASYTPVLSVVGERVYSGGFKLETTHFRRFHPYADLLAGAGRVEFDTPPGTDDHALVYTYGGGVDFVLSSRFSAKLDAQASRWRLNPTDIRHPSQLSIGLTYHIPLPQRFTR